MGNDDRVLSAVEMFVSSGHEVVRNFRCQASPNRELADHLQSIAERLIASHALIAAWMNRVRYFNFDAADAKKRYTEFAGDWANAKTSDELHRMKWDCGAIGRTYDDHIAKPLEEFTSQEERGKLQYAIGILAESDAAMAVTIKEDVVAFIDSFVSDVDEFLLAKNEINAAIVRKLTFMSDTASFMQQIEKLSNGLADLVLEFYTISGRAPK